MSKRTPAGIALRMTLVYLVVAGLWIVLSDRLVMILAGDPAHTAQLQTLKGWGFVAVTGALIFLVRLRAEQRHALADEQLRQSEQRFRSAVQSMPILFDAFDEAGNIIVWNRECEQVSGYSAEEMIGNPQAMELLYPDETYRQQMLAEWAARGNDYRHWELTLTPKQGGERIVAWSDISGEVAIPGWASWGIGVDVTRRVQVEQSLQRANRALRALSGVGQNLVGARDEADLLQAACEMIVEVGGYRLAWVGYAEEDAEKSVRPVAQAGYEEGYLGTLQLTWADAERGRDPTGTAIRSGKPSLARYIQSDPAFGAWRDQAMARGYRSSIALPIGENGRCLGALNIYAAEADAFDDEEIKLLSELAADLAYGIQALRARAARDAAQAALVQREVLLESILRVAPIGIGMVVERVFRFINANFSHLSGFAAAELIGQSARMVYPDEETYQGVAIRKYPAVRQGRIGSVETVMQRKDGQLLNILLSSAAIDSTDLSRGVIFSAMDITPLKQAEQAQKLYAERLRILRAIDQAILTAGQPAEIAEAALSRILELIPGKSAAMALLDEKGGDSFPTVVVNHRGAIRLQEAHVSLAGLEEARARLEQGDYLLEGDLQAHESLPPHLETPRRNGIRSYLVVPLRSEGDILGLLTVGAEQPNLYTADHAELAQEVADQMAIALRQVRLREQVERHALDLEQRVAERTAELQRAVNLMAGREIRMAELKQVIVRLRSQLLAAGLQPVADDVLVSARADDDRRPGSEELP